MKKVISYNSIRMFSLKMFLPLLLSLAVTCMVANNWTNETAVEYWVRPENTLSCSPSIPPHQCITITDLVTDSINTSINGDMSVNVVFLPGTHVPKKTGFINVRNPDMAQQITANFTTISRQQNVIIKCESGHQIGFFFFNLSSLTMQKIKLYDCSYMVPLAFNKLPIVGTLSSIAVIGVSKLFMESVSIVKSRGLGMIVVITDYYDHNVVTLNRIMMNDSHNTNTNTQYRGNLLITMCSYKLKNTDITLTDSIISNGHCTYGYGRYSIFQCKSGGLTLAINTKHNSTEHTEHVHIVIKNCTFSNNTAEHVGGGIFLYNISNTGNSQDNNIHINITKSLFLKNTAKRRGGGLGIYTEGCILNISETEFRENTARLGGATHTSGNVEYTYNRCKFINNEAKEGAAIYSTEDFPTISNCTFKHNKGNALSRTCNTVNIQHGRCLIMKNVLIKDNKCRGIYLYKTALKLFGTNIIQGNYARKSDGGAILFQCLLPSICSKYATSNTSYIQFDSQSNATLSIINNTADTYGGGIAIRGNCRMKNDSYCFFRMKPNTLIMKYNRGKKGGDSIYGGYLKNCNMSIFDTIDKNISSPISSPPDRVCICSEDFTQTHNCSRSKHIYTYPGQRFQVPLICTGQFGYASRCKLQAKLNISSQGSISDEAQLQDIGLECKKLYYSIQIQQANSNYVLSMFIMIVKERNIDYDKEYPDTRKATINVTIKACPPGFILNNGKCNCTSYLTTQGITCSIDDERLLKNPLTWVGNYSGAIVVHQNCPFDYCKSAFKDVDPFHQQEQCDFSRTDVLCGACRPGLSLVLGTSQCNQCSNIYLLLLIPFALVGLILILLLLKCNITVSTGTINGLIFYANILQATQTAFFPRNFNHTFVTMLSVCVAWLNLDLGIETCFVNGLNAYYRTWLQFAFPFYIWTIVGLLILISRSSISVSKWTGSNTVSVLATLFLLSYAKLLRTCFDTLSSTTLTDVNGTTTSLWLLDARYTFLEWPHSLLFTAGLVTLLAHILPFTIILLTAPIIQRYSHHKPLHWVNKFKPLLDAYQGPYRAKSRYWTGLLLLARLVILTAVSFNVSGNQAINLMVIIVILTVLILTLTVFGIRKLYRSKLANFLELFFLGNLLLLVVTSLFLTKQADRFHGQNITICFMAGSALVVTMFILTYHCYVVCLRMKAVKKLTLKVKGTRNRGLETDNDAEVRSTHPTATATVVDLKTLLLEES